MQTATKQAITDASLLDKDGYTSTPKLENSMFYNTTTKQAVEFAPLSDKDGYAPIDYTG